MILAIYCCGGHGREVLTLANWINEIKHKWNEIIFADDNCNNLIPLKNKVLTFEQIKTQYNKSDCEFVIASGEPYLLKVLSQKVSGSGYKLTNLVAPDIRMESALQTAQGCIVQKHAIISCNVRIGKSTCISFASVLHHDVIIGDYCFIAANSTICGHVVINEGTYIGAGSVIRDEVKIGSNCIIGMGSVLTKDVPDNSVVYGNPAKVVGNNDSLQVFK